MTHNFNPKLITKTQIDNVEHVLLRPDMYVGSMEHFSEPLWIFDKKEQKMVKREVHYVPGLHKIFDEILVNAADNKVRDPAQSFITVDIDRSANQISITNDGAGIPIEYHKDHKVYIPELIFGQMMTSSNYDDDSRSIVGMISDIISYNIKQNDQNKNTPFRPKIIIIFFIQQ